MAKREIRLEHDDILRKKTRAVEKVDKRIITLLDDMAETMYAADGVGLAAPQVGVLRRVCVIDDGNGKIELINPEIILDEGEQDGLEGCLSFPDQYGKVKRPMKIKVRALNREGKLREIEGEGLLARAICHEVDHLDGKLFVDLAYHMCSEEELKEMDQEHEA